MAYQFNGRRCCHSHFRPHNRMHPRAKILVRQADDDGLGDGRMAEQCGFDFGGIDIAPARKDQVGAAVGDIEIAFRVHPAVIAQ